MSTSLTINPNPSLPSGMDYALLLSEGVSHIQSLAGDNWTDHNQHDPGITMLEEVCYALTDLGYRLNFNTEDLLASGQATPVAPLYTPGALLTSRPVTFLDLRKILIDLEGVQNAWVSKLEVPEPAIYRDSDDNLTLQPQLGQQPLALKGIYQVEISPFPALQSLTEYEELLDRVRQRLHTHRNLCEDFVLHQTPLKMKIKELLLNAEIVISESEDPEALLARIWQAIVEVISPRIPFQTLPELQEKGMSVEEILDGPWLEHGFIDTQALENTPRPTEIRCSDLIAAVMALPGVEVVKKMEVGISGFLREWIFELGRGEIPALDPVNDATITLIREQIPVTPDLVRTATLYQELQNAITEPNPGLGDRDLLPTLGRDRKVTEYQSLLDQFPDTYGINAFGLPDSAAPNRKARARQLSAYLLLFDQVLANLFAQAGNLNQLFSLRNTPAFTYFSQPLEERRLENAVEKGLVEFTDLSAWQTALDTWTQTMGQEDRRQVRIANHLMARFGQFPGDFLFPADAGSQSPVLQVPIFRDFLNDFPRLSKDRNGAFNYAQPAWDNDNVSGLEARIALLLGITGYSRRNFVTEATGNTLIAEEGFHLVEHILLRPIPADQGNAGPADYPGPITQTVPFFDTVTLDNFTIVTAPEHGLTEGTWIVIFDEIGNEEERRAERVDTDEFYVTPPLSFGPNAMLSWEFSQPLTPEPLTFTFLEAQERDPFSLEISFVFPGEAGRFTDPDFRQIVLRILEREVPSHLAWDIHWLDNEEMLEFEAAWEIWLTELNNYAHV